MNKQDFKMIEFRSELIELTRKYHINISGTQFDDGSMNLEDCPLPTLIDTINSCYTKSEGNDRNESTV